MKRKIITVIGLMFLLSGIAILLYPEILSIVKQKQSDHIEERLRKNNNRLKRDDPLYQKAVNYNKTIYLNGQKELKDVWSYQVAPDIFVEKGQKTFGYISVPKMKQRLPLYLGATMRNLRRGAAILGKTSLPLGQSNSNCVIAAHRGYQGIPYFRDIEQLEKGDIVIIRNPWEKLKYQVTDICVINSYDMQKIYIKKGKDMISLLTCHPYRGKGKYRYLVYCERYYGHQIREKQEETVVENSSKKEIVKEKILRYSCVILLIVTGGVWLCGKSKNRMKG